MTILNIGRVRIGWTGVWDAATAYTAFDAVTYEGGSYACTTDSEAGILPTNTTYWQVMALKGVDGADGVDGAQGDQGSQGIQGVQGVQGTQGDAGVTGDTGPIGNDGSQGITGDTGIQGSTGPTGPEGPDGPQGTQGTQGVQGIDGPVGADGPEGDVTWQPKTNTYTAVSRESIIADTSGGVWTLTLPVTPTIGDYVQLLDGADWSVNNLTVARNGQTIEGDAEDLIMDIGKGSVDFIFDGTTWNITAQIGGQSGEVGATGATGATGDTGDTGSDGADGADGAVGPDGAGDAFSFSVFTSSGTWTRPTDVKKVLLYVTGSGGGPSTDNNPAGNPGWTVFKELDVSSISSAAISIGAAGGVGGNHYTNPAGNPSTFIGGGSTVRAAGGAGGSGSPGSNSNFDLAIFNKYPDSYGGVQTAGLVYILEFK
jgi:collagen type II alpha